jgi:hypothetical protein
MTDDKKDTKQEPVAKDRSAEEKPDPSVKPPVHILVGELRRERRDQRNKEGE